MQEDLSKDDLTSIKERIITAKANHEANLERLYAAHAADYLDDQRLRRESREEYVLSEAEVGDSKLAEWSAKRDVRFSLRAGQKTKLYRSSAPFINRSSLSSIPLKFNCNRKFAVCHCHPFPFPPESGN
jgi:hypothetical protein